MINPGNGPGPNALPDANYTREIPRLALYTNVRLLGYVAITYTNRDIGLVRRDVETYAGWPVNGSNPDLAVQGIFFDETPQEYDDRALGYFQELRDLVKGSSGLGPDNHVRFVYSSRCFYLTLFTMRFNSCTSVITNITRYSTTPASSPTPATYQQPIPS